MKFPIKKYLNISEYLKDYIKEHSKSFLATEFKTLEKICRALEKNYKSKYSKLLICGNGGSAAIANHFACDHQKILYSTKKFRPKIISLCSNSALLTAIANDQDYENSFSEQVLQYSTKNSFDILLVISSSGNSKNILKAIQSAKKIGIKTISLTGFDGGGAKKNADLNLHIPSFNYGIVESIHHSIMNIVGQYLRNKVLNIRQIKKTIF
jgi:D-sedoheptulose 7-phosphate isomerase